jgi:FKBP-type peptidyl-prolyl cis-trans isomerase FkpA
MQRSLRDFDLSATELDIVRRAITDGAAGKPAIDLDEFGPKVQPLAEARRERLIARERAASLAYLVTAAAEPGTVETTSGLVYRELQTGTGASPSASDFVRVHYRGTFIDGTEFDSSYGRNEPASFLLREVIGCWTEGVQRMRVGGKSRLVCPAALAYGEAGTPDIPGGATLIFEIELAGIVR